MRSLRPIIIATVLALSASGCTSTQPWVQNVQQSSSKAAEAARQAASATSARMRAYMAEKDLLKTFTDAGEHGESEVLRELHRARAATPAKSTAPGVQAASVGAGAPLARVPRSTQPNAGPYRWPLDAYIVSSEFGQRWGKMHKGIDLAAESGEPVYAIADGQVIYAGDGLRGYGNVVIIEHDGRMSSLYAHNSELKVKKGDTVSQGTLIALLGSTGHSTGPHVHFEIREGDTAVDPATVLPTPKFAASLAKR
jgi:murein DD-endopeptidase MepM/ murein hydrolase activator NlpD